MEHRESVGRYMAYIYRSGQSFIAKELEKYSIGSGQYIYLLALYRKDGIIQDTLVDLIKVDKATVTRAIKKLEDEGFVTRKKSTTDKRAMEIYLTEKGREFQPVIDEVLGQWMKIILGDFSEEEKDMLLYLLKKIFLNLSLNEADCWKGEGK